MSLKFQSPQMIKYSPLELMMIDIYTFDGEVGFS